MLASHPSQAINSKLNPNLLHTQQAVLNILPLLTKFSAFLTDKQYETHYTESPTLVVPHPPLPCTATDMKMSV